MVTDRTTDREQAAEVAKLAGAYDEPAAREPCVVALSGATGQKLRVINRTVRVGRGQQADWRFDEAGLSRLHMALRPDSDGNVVVEDLRSTNGTFCNGESLEGDRVLRDGDTLRLGTRTVLRFSYQTVAEQTYHQRHASAEDDDVLSGLLRSHTCAHTETAPGDAVVASPKMESIYQILERIAGRDISVLLLGDTGVGKEVLAHHIHRRSKRAKEKFIKFDCAALPESLLESALFGHERGAFTGATKEKKGLLEAAHKGTVFLDEIGDMATGTQVKLLRAIETREVMRVGGIEPRRLDIRVITATHRKIHQMVERGEFRRDLLYRINGITVEVPPLHERREEIEPLAERFLRRFAARDGTEVPGISFDALEAMRVYAWPGNIRELRNAVERATALCRNRTITLSDLPPEVRDGSCIYPTNEMPSIRTMERNLEAPATPLAQGDVGERQELIRALAETGGNQKEAAKLLGVSRSTIMRRIKKYGLPRPRT